MPHWLPLVGKLSLLAFLVSGMAATGMEIAPGRIAAPLREPRIMLPALGLNFILSPALAWLLAGAFRLDRGLAAGLMLIGGAAGAPFLPKLLKAAGCELDRGVALMALLTAGTMVFLPFALPHMISGFTADPWEIARPLLVWLALPFAGGMLIKRFAPRLSARVAPPLGKAGSVFLLVFFVLLLVEQFGALLGLFGSGALVAAALHAALLFAAGWWIGGRHHESGGVLGLATCARNFGAALVPAATSLRDPRVTLMLVAGAIAGIVVSFTAAFWLKRKAQSHINSPTLP